MKRNNIIIALFIGAILILSAGLAITSFAFSNKGGNTSSSHMNPRLTVLFPNGGETLSSGQLYYLRWQTPLSKDGKYADTFDVWLVDQETRQEKKIFGELRVDHDSAGWYAAPFKETTANSFRKTVSGKYIIRIECWYQRCGWDESDAPFYIVP